MPERPRLITTTRRESPWDADCAACAEKISDRLSAAGHYAEALSWPMFLCPDCGNKRCPKATSHENLCGRSNEPGQSGSRYLPANPTETP